MASNVAHDKPETEEQPTVKKLRIDEDAASVESNASGEDKMESADEASPSEATTLTVDVTPSPSTETGTPHAATPKVASAANTPKPAASGFSAFSSGGFGSFASGSGFSSFAKPAESSGFSSGFGAFASAASDSSSGFSGFAKKAEGATGFGAFAQGDDSAEGFGESASADFDPNSDEATAEFTPVVSLTEAEVANGEEQERIVVEKRAKLFKLVGADYTEVGVGPFRVLQPRDVNDTEQAKATARMVMRRESYPRGPGTKLILNSRLTAFISSVPKSEKSLMVVILERESGQLEEGQADKSGDAVKPVTYLLRFSTHEDLVEVQKRVVELLPPHATTA